MLWCCLAVDLFQFSGFVDLLDLFQFIAALSWHPVLLSLLLPLFPRLVSLLLDFYNLA